MVRPGLLAESDMLGFLVVAAFFTLCLLSLHLFWHVFHDD